MDPIRQTRINPRRRATISQNDQPSGTRELARRAAAAGHYIFVLQSVNHLFCFVFVDVCCCCCCYRLPFRSIADSHCKSDILIDQLSFCFFFGRLCFCFLIICLFDVTIRGFLLFRLTLSWFLFV